MMSEVKVLLALRRELRTYKSSLEDVVGKGEYIHGFINGLARAMEIICQHARAFNHQDKVMRKRARYFTLGFLFKKICAVDRMLYHGNKSLAMKQLRAIINAHQGQL